jgi:enterochelin esterase-like enzyme
MPRKTLMDIKQQGWFIRLWLIVGLLAACQPMTDKADIPLPTATLLATDVPIVSTSTTLITATSQPTKSPTEAVPTTVTADKSSSCENFEFTSAKLKETLTIEVALPDGYEDSSTEEYSSIYLLDANYFFDEQPGTLDFFLERGGGMTNMLRTLIESGDIPPSILIGIGYTEDQRMELAMNKPIQFYSFLKDELIPEVESRCKVSSSADDRVLVGYSASARLSTYALLRDILTERQTFMRVISISGLYDNKVMALEEDVFQQFGADAFAGRHFYLAVGDQDSTIYLSRGSQPLVLLDAHRAFTAMLESRGYKGKIKFEELPDKGHYNIPEFIFPVAINWVFLD